MEEVSEAFASSVAAGDGASDFEDLWKAYPHVKGRSSRPKALEAWGSVAGDVRHCLPMAARRFARSDAVPESGACALHRWLGEERYRDWLGEAPPVAAPQTLAERIAYINGGRR